MFRGYRRPEKGFFEEFSKEFEEMNELMNRMIHIEKFGNIPIYVREKVREPFTSSLIDDKNNELKITADMPGIKKEDIQVDATEDEVIIRADGERKYYKKLEIPCPVDSDSAKAIYNNGVLEISFKLKEPLKPKGKPIKIE